MRVWKEAYRSSFKHLKFVRREDEILFESRTFHPTCLKHEYDHTYPLEIEVPSILI